MDCVADGRAALDMATYCRYDVVLPDIRMPRVDGYAVLEQLKETPATRDIPVLMVSAVDDVASVVRCIERGAEDHLSKPFEQVLLQARIRTCLAKKRLADVELQYLPCLLANLVSPRLTSPALLSPSRAASSSSALRSRTTRPYPSPRQLSCFAPSRTLCIPSQIGQRESP